MNSVQPLLRYPSDRTCMACNIAWIRSAVEEVCARELNAIVLASQADLLLGGTLLENFRGGSDF